MKTMSPETVYLHCSTTKRQYELLFSKDQLENFPEYIHIREQMDFLLKKYPKIKVKIQ